MTHNKLHTASKHLMHIFCGRNNKILIVSFLIWSAYGQQLRAQPNINRVEYYVDTDPGYGNGIAMTIGAGNNVSGSFTIDMTAISEGVHIVGIRSRDINGGWSIDNKWIFLKPFTGVATGLVPNITRLEYFVDADPGYGNGIPLSISPNTNVSNIAINIDLIPLNEGVHIVGIRAKDANGTWSIDNKWIFLKAYSSGALAPVPNITRVEYFIDTDPGYGNANPLSITPGTTIAAIPINLDLTSMTTGVHIVGIRAKDAYGAWSADNRWLFLKQSQNGQPAVARKISAMEYYYDNDPGYGNGVQVAIDQQTFISDKPIFANLTNLSAGKHYYFLRTRDNLGAWSFDYKDSFTLASAIAAPFINLNSITLSNLCKQANFSIGYHATGNYLGGNQFIVEMSDGSGSFVAPVTIGSVSSTSNGIINCIIPVASSNGNAYKMRLRSTNPILTSPDLPIPITIYKYFIGNDTSINALCDVANVSIVFNLQGGTTVWNTPNPSQAPLGTYQVIATNQLGCTDTANATVSLDVLTWTGTSNTNWFNQANWSPAKIPSDTSHVIINSSTPFVCTINAANAKAASVQLKNGASVKVNTGFTLSIKGNCNALPPAAAPPGNQFQKQTSSLQIPKHQE